VYGHTALLEGCCHREHLSNGKDSRVKEEKPRVGVEEPKLGEGKDQT